MNWKSGLFILPLAVGLLSCGGEETSEVTETAQATEQQEWGSTFGECTSNNSFTYTDKVKDEFVIQDYLTGDESFPHYGGEITKNKKSLYIQFTTNKEMVNKALGQLKEGDVTMSLNINTGNNEELKAGEYKKGDINMSLTRATRTAEGLRSASLGSNKRQEKVTINKITDGYVCGTYWMLSENGDELIKIEFNTAIKQSAW